MSIKAVFIYRLPIKFFYHKASFIYTKEPIQENTYITFYFITMQVRAKNLE